MKNIKKLCFELSQRDAAVETSAAADFAFNYLSEFLVAEKMDGLGVVGFLKGEKDYTLMLDAHIDQISMVVTAIDDKGFLTVSSAGAVDLRALPSKRVIVHGREKVLGVFCSVPPHLSKKKTDYDDISELKIDTGLKNPKEIISVGDGVTFYGEPVTLLGNRICGKSLDNRISVAILLDLAKRLSDERLPFNVAFVLSDGEELGLRGTRTATYKVNPQEAIILDVTFGDGLGISPDQCGELSRGGMIGVSPVLERKIGKRLIKIAEEKSLPYGVEPMGERTGTNADMVGITREGVPCCTLSVPLRNMHSDVEIVDLEDAKAVSDLLYSYVMGGGIMND